MLFRPTERQGAGGIAFRGKKLRILCLPEEAGGIYGRVASGCTATGEMVAISLWETKGYAEIYNREVYPRVEKIVTKFIAGVPIVQNFDEKYASFHEVAVLTTVGS
jgi:hypothetical protein